MADASTAVAKPAKPAPPPPAAPAAAAPQGLRQQQPRKFKPSSLMELGQNHITLTVIAPADWDFEDVLKPIAWGNVFALVARDALNTRRDKIGSLIEVRSEDHAYLAVLYIEAVLSDGLRVRCIGPSVDPETGKACPVDIKTGMPWTGRKTSAN